MKDLGAARSAGERCNAVGGICLSPRICTPHKCENASVNAWVAGLDDTDELREAIRRSICDDVPCNHEPGKDCCACNDAASGVMLVLQARRQRATARNPESPND